jgi:glycosyltransferase involved in cell wall biosynthesis
MTRKAPAFARRSDRIRVVHLITDAGPHPYFETLAEHADRERFRLAVGCIGPPGDLQGRMRAAGIETFALGARSRSAYPGAVLRLAHRLSRGRSDIVQTHLVDACLAGLTAARLARTPVAVHTAHHSHELPFHGSRLLYAERLCTGPLSDHIIAPSRSVADALVELAHAPREKIEVVPHGFNLKRLDVSSANPDRVRRELGLEGATVLGTLGRSFWLKNHAALVQAFAAVAADYPDVRLVIAGPGDKDDLESLAGALDVHDRVVLVGARGDVPDLLAAFDVFVHPALAESFGMVIVEAMAMRRPVVTTRVGIAEDAIEPAVSGILADGPDSGALERALREVLARRDRWSDMGAAARRRAETFQAANMVRAYEDRYLTWRGMRQ